MEYLNSDQPTPTPQTDAQRADMIRSAPKQDQSELKNAWAQERSEGRIEGVYKPLRQRIQEQKVLLSPFAEILYGMSNPAEMAKAFGYEVLEKVAIGPFDRARIEAKMMSASLRDTAGRLRKIIGGSGQS